MVLLLREGRRGGEEEMREEGKCYALPVENS